MPITYRVRVVHGDSHFEAEGDRKFVIDMVSRFEARSPGSIAPPREADLPPRAHTGRVTKSMSVREFVARLGLKRHTDIVLAFGYYLEHELAKPSFTAADINGLYYEAKMEPSNTSQACIQNIRQSRLMEDKGGKAKAGRRAYTLTHTGEEFITKRLAKPVS